MWRGYVKDQLNLENVPKAFLKIKSFNIKEDLLTSATSSFDCVEVKDNISNGDVLIVADETGITKYLGVINSIDENTINTTQIQSIYKGNWLYDLPNIIGVGNDKSWHWDRYDYLIDPTKDYKHWNNSDLPKLEALENLQIRESRTLLDSSTSLTMNLGEKYTACATTYVYSETRKNITMVFSSDNGGILYVNGADVGSYVYYDSSTQTLRVPIECPVTIRKGWNKVQVVYSEETGGDGWLVTINGFHLNEYFSELTSQYTSNVTSLEDTFAQALRLYANGKMRDSSYTDDLIKQRLSSIEIKTSSQTQGAFLTQEDTYVCDMEEFIYSLYNRYQIQLTFDIPYQGKCTCTIGKSNIGEIKIGNNTNAIVDISPITEVEETNRLIIYNKDGTYRATYVTKADGSRVKEPIGTANRFGVVKTAIVFSDDDDQTLQWGYLPKMYNHKLTFTLRLLNRVNVPVKYTKMVDKYISTFQDEHITTELNRPIVATVPEITNKNVGMYLYSFDDFKLGMPLAIWKDTDYFSTILTGREMAKDENAPINEVNYTCGTVRTKLTEKLLIKYGVQNVR